MSEIITMAHGGGGETMRKLLAQEIAVLYNGDAQWDDATVLTGHPRIAVTTDSFVISPLIFPGGDVGKLAAAGTINDLAMRGATPRYMTVGLIIEEGLELATLRTVLASLRATCDEAGVAVVAGDTKVVEHGSGDGLFINTAGIGVIETDTPPGGDRVQPGDHVIVNGFLADHGVAILAARNELPLSTPVKSDCAPLSDLVSTLMDAGGASVHAMRDLTRGGLAAALNEIADQSGVSISLQENAIPVRPEVRGACEILGFDPLQIANEGKLVAFVAAGDAERVVAAMRAHPLGTGTSVIGEVVQDARNRVTVRTALGTRRALTMPAGELLPRIC